MRQLVTKGGYLLFEVSSAFQKSVRRGLEDEAMYWAVELWQSGYDEYLWRRIKIISSEDIGLAEPHISSEVYALYQMYQEQKSYDKKNKENEFPSQRMFLTHTILMICRAKKSRLADWFQVWTFRRHKREKRQIPDWALDKHTSRGARMGRGIAHFVEEGAKLENAVLLDNEDFYKQKAVEELNRPAEETEENKDWKLFNILT